jgi:predicted RND superfamily exporter protein
VAANDSVDQRGRRTADRLLLAGRRRHSLPLRGAGLPGLDRRSGGVAPPASARWRFFATVAVGLLTLLAAVGLSRLRIDDDLRALLRDADADFRLVDEVASRFGAPDRDCIIRVTARSGDLFEARPLAALRVLADRLADVDGVEQVRSMFGIRRQGVVGAVLPVIPDVEGELTAAEGEAAKSRAIGHPLIKDHLLSADASSSLLIARLEAAADSPPRLGEVVARIERLLATAESENGVLKLELTGLPALREQAGQALRHDMLFFNSLGLGLAVVLSACVARSARSTIVACVPPFVGAVWAMGIIGLCGVPVNLLTSVVPSLALVVGTCDSIHFIEDMRRSARRGVAGVAASSGAIRRVGVACGLTSLVTAIGFASLGAARIDAVRNFGLAAAAGAVASFLAVTLLTPLLASTPAFSGMRLGRSSRHAGRLASSLTAFSVRHAWPITAVGCAATLLLAAVAAGLDADNRVVDSLPRGAAASRALASVDSEFGGVMGVDVVVRWPEGLGWLDTPVLDSLDKVHQVLEQSGGITRAISLATVAATLPQRARQRLDAAEFRDLVDEDSRLAIVRARVNDLGSKKLEGIYDRIDASLAALAAERPGWTFELAGMSVVSARNIRQLVRDLGSSLLLEVAVIGGILAVAFRSPLAGIVSLIPNVFPLAVIGALLVALGRSLDPATVIVFNVCLGLAVDDTVHVLSALQRQRREGVSIASAVRRAVAETGNAVVLGGIVLAIGFAAVTVSSVPALAGFGMLACAAVAAATVAELVFLPALLVVTDTFVRRQPAARHDGIFGSEPLPWTARKLAG